MVLADVPLYQSPVRGYKNGTTDPQKPKRGYKERNNGTTNRNEGRFPQTALLFPLNHRVKGTR